MTRSKALQWAQWWAAQAEANRDRAITHLTTAQRRTAISDAQFAAAYFMKRAQEATE